MNVLKNTASGLIQRFATIISGFVIQILFIRILGIEYAGISSLFTSILSVLSLAELGIGTAITYNLYKPIVQGDYEQMSAYVRFFAKAYRWVAVIVAVLALCLLPFLDYLVTGAENVRENIRILYLLTLADTVLSYLLVYKSTVLIAAQKNRIVTNIQTLACIVKCVLLVAILLIWKNYYLVLILYALITLAQNLTISICADREFPQLKRYKGKLSKTESKQLLANVRAMALYKVSGVVLNSTDNIIISSTLGARTVGILSNYNYVLNNVYNVVMQFFSATSSSVGNLSVDNDAEKEHGIFSVLNFISFWIYGFCTVAIFVMAQPFISLAFGSEYLFSTIVLLALVLDFYIKGMLSPVTSFRNAHGLFVQGKYRPLIMALINVGLSLLLLKYIGLVGVFLATIISRLCTQVWYDPWLVYKSVFKRKVSKYYVKYIIYGLMVAVAGTVAWLLAGLIPFENLILQLILRGVLCIVIYHLLLVTLFYKTKEFRMTLSIVKSLLTRLFRGKKRFCERNQIND